MDGKTTIKVSKLDAARRQLETAVRLYFSEADPVSIHTLRSAANQVLSDLNRARGGTPMLKEQIPSWVQPDSTDRVKKKLNEATTFSTTPTGITTTYLNSTKNNPSYSFTML